MKKIKIVPHNGRDTLFINGTPNPQLLSKQDYETLIASLELDIRNYYKPQDDPFDDNPDARPP